MGFGDIRSYTEEQWLNGELTGFIADVQPGSETHWYARINHDCPADRNGDDMVSTWFLVAKHFYPKLDQNKKALIRFWVRIQGENKHAEGIAILITDDHLWRLIRENAREAL